MAQCKSGSVSLMRLARFCLVACAVSMTVVSSAAAAVWSVEPLNLPGPLTELRQVGPSVYLRAGEWVRLEPCAGGLCRTAAAPPKRQTARDGIPHGFMAVGANDIEQAWYARPTDRYGHGVLGDRIEAGALVVVDDGERFSHRLGGQHVFEDLTPRIADLDGDGADEVVVIRSGLRSGAALAVYGIANGSLSEVAATRPIGRSNRWLNVAGIADYTGDGRPDIATVVTPHIGGRLEFWTLDGGRLRRADAARGFSNHAIGSTELGLSATADIDGDGVVDLALPDAGRTALRLVSARGGRIVDLANVPVGGRISTAIGVVMLGSRPVFVFGLDNGDAVAVSGAK
ncbi:MAG: VCBS repeat-containing protein [Hyphomicrobiales bacterium]|nr:VCBS repeat-containing protein [Hyphomicrobiales bacterium]